MGIKQCLSDRQVMLRKWHGFISLGIMYSQFIPVCMYNVILGVAGKTDLVEVE